MRYKSPLLLCVTGVSSCTLSAFALSAGSWCGTLMCINATANGNIFTYELKALNQLGWMSIGFGSQMNNTSLVIMWPNSDGSVTLSQRVANGHSPPLPVPSPPRKATISQNTNLSSSTSPILAFDITQDVDDSESLIWAFAVTRPDPDADSDIEQHLDAGSFSLDFDVDSKSHSDGGGDDDDDKGSSSSSGAPPSSLTSQSTTSLSSPAGSATSIPATTTSSSSSTTTSLSDSLSSSPSPSPSELSDTSSNLRHHHVNALLIAHATLSFLGFAVFLPLAVLIARWTRTLTTRWFRAHWMTIALLAAPCMAVGWALGPLLVEQQGHPHVVNEHQIGGVALFAICLVQMSLGPLIHLLRPKSGTAHPLRNIVHVALGLFILGFSFFEVKTGITRDWALDAGTQKILSIFCILWAIVVSIAYLIGLMLLRRQFHQERLGWHLQLASRSTPPIIEVGSTNHSQAERSSSSGRRLDMWRSGTRADDDGTHDIFSQTTSSGPTSGTEDFSDIVEMREVQRVPITYPSLRLH